MTTTSRRVAVLGGAFLLLVAVAVASVAGALLWPRQAVAPTLASPVASPAAALAPVEAAAYRELAPRLTAAASQARLLVDLGVARERNLLVIRREQDTSAARLAEVDVLAAAAPPRFAPALAAYAEGARAVRRAMAEAQAGFIRFDWDRVAGATRMMERGAEQIERAADLLDAAAGVPTTPRSSPSPNTP